MNFTSVHSLLARLAPLDPDIGFALLVAGLVIAALWIGALQSCFGNEPPDGTRRTWLLLILLLGPIGAFAYLFYRRPQRIRDIGW